MDDLTNRTLVKVELGKDANPFNLVGCVVGHMCQLRSYRVLVLVVQRKKLGLQPTYWSYDIKLVNAVTVRPTCWLYIVNWS